MLSKGAYYDEQQSDEKIIHFIRRHPLSMGSWIVSIISLVVALIIPFVIFQEDIIKGIFISKNIHYIIVTIACYLLLIFAVSLTSWINYYLDVIVITSNHLVNIKNIGLFRREVSEQNLARVQDVSSKMNGFWQTLFRYGTVYVETAGEAPNFIMENVPRPYKIANTIMKLHESIINNNSQITQEIFVKKQNNNLINKKVNNNNKNINKNSINNSKINQPVANLTNTSKNNKSLIINENTLINLGKSQDFKKNKYSQEGELQEGQEIKF